MEGAVLSSPELARLQAELAVAHDAREAKRALALIDVAEGEAISSVAEKIQVTRATIYNWIHTLQSDRSAHPLHDSPRSGRPTLWTQTLDGVFRYSMKADPEDFGYPTVGWTVKLLQHQLERCTGVKPSDDTIRQHLHALGYVWKRPRYRLQTDPQRAIKQARILRKLRKIGPRTHILAQDETDLRLFPPLHGVWTLKGKTREVSLSGSNAKRVVFGSINIKTGKRLYLVHKSGTAEDFQIYLEYVRSHYRGWNVRMLLDEDSSHTAKASVAFAEKMGIDLLWLPIRSPELNPVEDIWRDGKKTICANHQYESIDVEAHKFIQYLTLQSNHTALTKSGLLSKNFWLNEFVSKNFSLLT